jgi:hypothetical protein
MFTEPTNRGAIALFEGAFTKLRKATICFVMSARPSVYPNQATRLPLELF